MLTLLLWLQQVEPPNTHWFTSSEMRSAMLGVVVAMGGFVLRFLSKTLNRLEDVCGKLHDIERDIKRDIPEIKELLALHEKEIRWLTGKRIAQEAIEEAERQNYQGPEKRHRLRRDRDIVNDALSHSDEHRTEDTDR